MHKFREIERLRGLAITLAVFNHAPLNSFYPWFSGVNGVHLFFVISGFVITLSLLRLFGTASPREAIGRLKIFFVRRFFRLFPMALFSVLFALAASRWLNSSHIWGPPVAVLHEAFLAFTLRYNYVLGHTGRNLVYFWSLNVEEHFYLVLPWLLILAYDKRSRVIMAGALLLLVTLVVRPLTSVSLEHGIYWVFAHHYNTHVRVDALMAGVLLGLIHHYRIIPRPRATRRLRIGGNTIATLAVLTLIYVHRFISPVYETSWTLVDIASIALVGAASLRRGLVFLVPFLGGFLEYLGARAYCIYLLHMPMWRLFEQLRFVNPVFGAGSIPALSFLFIIATLALSELCHQFIEKPFMRSAIIDKLADNRIRGMQPLAPPAE